MYTSLNDIKEMMEQYAARCLPQRKVQSVVPFAFSAYNNDSKAQVANDDSTCFYYGSLLTTLPVATASQGTMNFYLPGAEKGKLAFSFDSTVRDGWTGKNILQEHVHHVYFQNWSISAIATSSPAAGFYFSGFKIELL